MQRFGNEHEHKFLMSHSRASKNPDTEALSPELNLNQVTVFTLL